MTITKAFNKAIKVWEQEKGKTAELRGAELWEMTGRNGKYEYLLVRITYATMQDGEAGDYTESDKNPYLVRVDDQDGVITARHI